MASSLQARASEFDASVSAQVAHARQSAEEVLKHVSGTGNAIADVSVRGLPTATTGGRRAAVVTITNSTHSAASYAVQIDFTDKSGKTVDTSFLKVTDVAPGGTDSSQAISSRVTAVPEVVKAQRY